MCSYHWFIIYIVCACFLFFFFKQKTAYEMRISDWSSDVCSSDLPVGAVPHCGLSRSVEPRPCRVDRRARAGRRRLAGQQEGTPPARYLARLGGEDELLALRRDPRSEEHTSELQSLMRISYAVFCLKKKKPVTHKYRQQQPIIP